MLIDLASAHNFIHCKITKDLNFFIYLALEFQVMVTYGGAINCAGKFHNINLTME